MNIKREIGEALGDAAREGIERLAKSVDDWGWKGAKKGEISGSDVWNDPRGTYVKFLDQIKLDKDLAPLVPFEPSSPYVVGEASNKALDIANGFRMMEQAGLPRKYTGKLYKALMQRSGVREVVSPYDAWGASNAMAAMTPEQKETFLQLLPRWTGALEQAAATAKKLYRRPS